MFSELLLSSMVCASGASAPARTLADSVDTSTNCTKYVTVKATPVTQVKQLDLLFVIDDSGSMQSHQTNFAANIDAITNTLMVNGIDTNVGVITTSLGSTMSPFGDGRMVGAHPVLNNSMPGFQAELKANLLVGTQGAGVETPFSTIKMALSEPNLSTYNKGFLRTGGSLAIVMLTDAEDQSQMSAKDMDAFLQTVKGAGNYIVTGAIIPSTVPNASCPRNDQAVHPVKIEELIGLSHGLSTNLCDPAFGQNLKDFGSGISIQSKRSYALPTQPRDLMSITVKYGSHSLQIGNMKKGWMYDFASQSVVIGPEFDFASEPAGTELEIRYIEK